MKYLIKVALPALILIGAVSIAWMMIANRPVANQKPAEPPTLLVNSFIAESADAPISISISGTIAPHTETTLVSEVAGRITEVSPAFLNGGFFRKGDVLLRIDPRNHEAELKRAQASLVRARMQLAQEQSLADYERGDFEKLKSVSPDALATSDLTFRAAKLAQVMADVVGAEAQVIRAQGDLDRTEIRMPYDGLVREKRADLGQFVNPGTPLGVMFAIDYAEVRLPLSPTQARELPLPGYQVDGETTPVLISAVDSEQTWDGNLVRTEGVLDEKSRTLYVIARVEDPYGFVAQRDMEPLRIGAFVDVTIPGRVLTDVVTVDRHMLKPGNRIWIIDDEMRIQHRKVTVAYADSQHAYIESGLTSGDRVCITPIDNPLPGTRVRIVEDESLAGS